MLGLHVGNWSTMMQSGHDEEEGVAVAADGAYLWRHTVTPDFLPLHELLAALRTILEVTGQD